MVYDSESGKFHFIHLCYLADIPKVMRDLIFELEWLAEYGNPDMKQAVGPFNEWLREVILPAYQSKFVQQYI